MEDYFDGTRSVSVSMDAVRDAAQNEDTITSERAAIDNGPAPCGDHVRRQDPGAPRAWHQLGGASPWCRSCC